MHVSAYDSFTDLPEDVQFAWRYPQTPAFDSSLQWFKVLFEHGLAGDFVPRIYVIRSAQGAVLAIIPCYADRRTRNVLSLTSFYTIRFGIGGPLTNRLAQSVSESFAAYLAAETPAWVCVNFRYLQEGCPLTVALSRAFARHGLVVNEYFQYENWFADTKGLRFADFYRNRPSQLRNTIGRKEKRLCSTHAVEIRLVHGSSDRLESSIDDFVTVYQNSWKRPEPFPRFIPELIRSAADAGVLRLGLLYVDGVPAAGQLWLTSDRRAVIYKLAYDEHFKEHSVGSILSTALFRSALDEDGVDEIDYGVGSESYKRDWMTGVRRLVGLEMNNVRTIRGMARAIRNMAAHYVRRARSSHSAAA
jgi:hypothetical protein